MNSSRVNKYRDLRAGLKDEAGINRENIEDTIDIIDDIEDDDFLATINRSFKQEEKDLPDINDTLTEAKTFEQMRQESSEEINRALRSAKVSVGKEAQYNTRMDILNKIREPEKQVVHIDNLDNINTSEFSKGYFVNQEESVVTKAEEEKKAAKKKMTLMERLASMSPEEDAKKAKLVMDEVQEEAEQKENELEEALKKDTGVVSSGTAEDTLEDEELAKIEQTRSLEEILRQIKEKDQREVEKVLKQKEDTADLKVIKNQTNDKTIDSKSKAKQSRSDIVDEKKSDRIATILNYVIIFLVVVFIGLCGMIGYQLFF
ncbi:MULTISPECIES: hypothetical protein [Thomasclavelia]|uniref:hypothetical protein n=1 Tax=Thomasclavelia TaxID=3025755 RepID=UPI001C38AF5E|nr:MULTISPECIES: hypothetical protein [Thomasclavelia]MBV3128247.1 hypothetical protein [Thomasclavelia ramosa]MBV3132052.1 hypothetical protein [Thomasclavelia ramosa]MBV3140388.1 hypothetical protein [Thomasclavelia ramosa]MBV3143960.1 hypothetical protein [Thomasclavelia ramosa]MBV3152148.1 hypothetical protein [Thomasclavelia ramosa]